jgi:hypothetical protein
MAPASNREVLAHSVLLRYIPDLKRIITTTSFVQVYRGSFMPGGAFDWEKKDIAGTAFLVSSTSKTSPDREDYHIIILNRRSMNNFFWTLTSSEGIEDSEPHLLLNQNSGYSPIPVEPGYELEDRTCYGIWMFPSPTAPDEGTRLKQEIMRCAAIAGENNRALGGRIAKAETPKAIAPPPPPPPPQPRLLTAVPSAPQYGNENDAMLPGYSIMEKVFPQQQQQAAAQSNPSTPLPALNGDVLNMLLQSTRQR